MPYSPKEIIFKLTEVSISLRLILQYFIISVAFIFTHVASCTNYAFIYLFFLREVTFLTIFAAMQLKLAIESMRMETCVFIILTSTSNIVV